MFIPHINEFRPPNGRPVKYPIGHLKIGESIFLPGVTTRQISGVKRNHHPKLFDVCAVEENGARGVRVTRVLHYTPKKPTGRPANSPFWQLNVGDSIFVAGKNASSARDGYRHITGMKFKSKTVKRGGQIGTRIWRIA